MRTIKFRGKRVNRNGEWAYGDLRQINGECFVFPQSEGAACDRDKVIPDTVGQFTGLLDKNGNEIYEGDVVDFMAYEAIGNERGIVRFTIGGYQIGWYDMYNVFLNVFRNDDAVEVIGNIHDNPELMKQNK